MILSLAQDDAMHAWGELFVRLAPLIITMGVVGIVTIVGLVIAWRRFHARETQLEQRQADRHSPAMHVDTWGSAGQRLEPIPAPPHLGPPAYPGSEEDDMDDEDDDENAPWRQSLDIPDFGDDDDDVDDDEPDDVDFDDDWPRPK